MTHCGGGDVVSLVALLEGGDYAAAARVLATLDGQPAWRPVRGPPADAGPCGRPYTRRLRLDPAHPLLRQRGIRPSTAQLFEAGGWPLGGFLAECVGVRLHDPEGRPLGYAGRRVDPVQAERFGKWKFPAGLRKSQLLYNYHRLQTMVHGAVLVVEGPFDAMRVQQAGYPAVVALLGTSMSEAQRQLLATTQTLFLLLDGDRAGADGARRIAHAFPAGRVHVVALPPNLDPADLSDDALRDLLATHAASCRTRP